MDFSLDSRVIAVTGGLGCLGQAVAEVLGRLGATVALIDSAHGASAAPCPLVLGGVDLSQPSAALAALDAVAQRFGHVHGLVNLAGGFQWETLDGGSLDTWDCMYTTNLKTAVCATQAALPHLLRTPGAAIVHMGAQAAHKAGVGMGAYAASKAGVARLTEALAEELKDQGVRVNAVLPSILDTPRNRADMPDADFSRWVPPGDLAQVVAFLLSPLSCAVTGALVPVTART